jgi:hypothetical protein
MTIPENSYLTGILEVGEKAEYDAQQAVRRYHANRTVCLAKQKRQPVYRIAFLVMMMPLLAYFVSEFFQKDLSNYMAVIALCYTAAALPFVVLLKNLRIPAGCAWIYSAEVFRLNDASAIIPTLIPVIILNLIAFFYEKDRRWLTEQPGFPEFRDISVRVKEAAALSERDIPPSAGEADDPYSDVLSSLQ